LSKDIYIFYKDIYDFSNYVISYKLQKNFVYLENSENSEFIIGTCCSYMYKDMIIVNYIIIITISIKKIYANKNRTFRICFVRFYT